MTQSRAARAATVHNPRADTTKMLIALANVPGRHDTARSNEGTKAEAFKFRQRVYAHRRALLADLWPPDGDRAHATLAWFRNIGAPRITKDWLDLSRFRVVDLANGKFCVEGSIARMMMGDDLVFGAEQDAAVAQARQELFARAAGAKQQILDLEVIARDLQVNPAHLFRTAASLQVDGLTPEQIEAALRKQFA